MKMSKREFLMIMLLVAPTILGFMLKLPSIFRHHDREMHFLFYLLASIFLNMIFCQKKIKNHLIIFFCLLFFGIAIEFLQDFSNLFFEKKIHGHFDPVDVYFNFLGLICAELFWGFYLIFDRLVRDTEV